MFAGLGCSASALGELGRNYTFRGWQARLRETTITLFLEVTEDSFVLVRHSARVSVVPH
jgi:hypothetical protein